jgi:succinyl-diaminopimelate desuccinylase
VKGDRLYGLGSADTKLDFLCKLLAVEQVGPANIKIPLALIGTFGEERALAGARLIRETGILKPKFALIGEPSDLKAVVAHKGILYMRATLTRPPAALSREGRGQEKVFKGKAAHGSMPHLGENAVEKAMRWLASQEDLEVVTIEGGNVVPEQCRIDYQAISGAGSAPQTRAGTAFIRSFLHAMDAARAYLETHANPAFDPPHTTDNIGVVRTADDGTIMIEFDFRLIPETDGNEIFAILQAVEKEAPGARIEVIRSNAPMNTSPASELARRVERAQVDVGLKPEFLVKSGNTEGAIFNAMGVESIVIGPGHAVGNIHAPNEHNEISQLHKAVEFYTTFLNQFC